MKKSILKTILCVMLCVTLLGAVALTSACNAVPNSDSRLSSTASADGSGDSSSAPGGNDAEAQIVDRSDYTADKMAELITKANAYDVFVSLKGEKDSPLKDYMVGDFVNMIVAEAAKSFISSDSGEDIAQSPFDGIDLSEIGDEYGFDFGDFDPRDFFGNYSDLPTGTNVSAFSYEYYSDGYWRSNLNGEKVHRILNIILCYKPFGSEPIEFSAQDIETYGDATVIEILGYKNNELMKSVLYSNVVIGAAMDATVSEIAAFYSKNEEEIVGSISDIFGEIKLIDLAVALSLDIGEDYAEYEDLTVNDLIDRIYQIEEIGFDAYLSGLIGAYLESFIESYGEQTILNDVTVNDLIEALNSSVEDGEADFVSVILDLFGDAKLSDFAERYGFEIEEADGEKTIAEIIEMIVSSTDDPEPEPYGGDEAEYISLEEFVDYILETYGDYAVTEDLTVRDLLYLIEDSSSIVVYDDGETFLTIADLLAIFGSGDEELIAELSAMIEEMIENDSIGELIEEFNLSEFVFVNEDLSEKTVAEVLGGDYLTEMIEEYLKDKTIEELIAEIIAYYFQLNAQVEAI